MNMESGSTCFYSQLWDVRIMRIEQKKKLWLELFPLLCTFLAMRTGRSESFLWDSEGWNWWNIKRVRVKNPLLPWNKGNLLSSCVSQDQLYVEEVANRCNGYMSCHHSLFFHPTSDMLSSILSTTEESRKDTLFFCYIPTSSSAVPELHAGNLVQKGKWQKWLAILW